MGLSADRAGSALAARLSGAGAGLLLDLDGTLVDSEPVHRQAFADYFALRGWSVPDDVVRQFMGQRAPEVFPVLDGPWRGEDPHVLTEGVLDALRRSEARPVPVPGAQELLAACTRAGLPVVVVTSARREWLDGVLQVLELDGPTARSLTAVTAEDCTHGKPHPEPYLRGAERLGLPAAGLVAVEDAVAGVASARAAGIGHVIAVTTSRTAAELHSADEVLADLRPLARAVAAAQDVDRDSSTGTSPTAD